MLACCTGGVPHAHLPRPGAISSGYRGVPLKRYPHLVYRVEAGDVDVWCVLHAKRDIPHPMQEPDNHLPVGFCHVFKLQTHGRKHAA
jgi:plasmid stabilization system protein ParE